MWTFPYTHHLSTFSSADPFAPGAPLALKQLSSIIERLTYAATCELFLPPAQISLRELERAFGADTNAGPISTFPSDGRSKREREIAGALMMRQLATLESIGHKDGARGAMRRILDDLLSVYDASWAPVRRARVLIMTLGVAWRDPDGSTELDVDGIGQEALALLAREVGAAHLRVCVSEHSRGRQALESESLVGLVVQLRLSAHMWMALHAYRRSPAGAEMMNAVATHVEAAYAVLCGLLPGSEGKVGLEASPKGKLPGASAGSKSRGAVNGVAKRAKGRPAVESAAKGGKKTAVDTTKSQGRKGELISRDNGDTLIDGACIVLRAVSLNAAEPAPCHAPVIKRPAPATALHLQPILGLIRRRHHSFFRDVMSTDGETLEMNVHLLGLLGLIVLKVKLLEILKRVCEYQTPVPAEGRPISFSYTRLLTMTLFDSIFRDLRRPGARVHEAR